MSTNKPCRNAAAGIRPGDTTGRLAASCDQAMTSSGFIVVLPCQLAL